MGQYDSCGKEIRVKLDALARVQVLALPASTSGHGFDVDKKSTSSLHAQGGSGVPEKGILDKLLVH